MHDEIRRYILMYVRQRSDAVMYITAIYTYSIGNSTELQYKVNEGSYELPLFKPPLCKVADAECNVSIG